MEDKLAKALEPIAEYLSEKIFTASLEALSTALQLHGLAVQKQDFKPAKRIPIDINRAMEVTGLAKPTIYVKAPKGEMPGYRKGKRWYFFEDELIEWVRSGKHSSKEDLEIQADSILRKRA